MSRVRKFQRGEKVASYESPKRSGIVTGKTRGKHQVQVYFPKERQSIYMPFDKLFSWEAYCYGYSRTFLSCPTCNEKTNQTLNCGYSRCFHCSKIKLDHERRICCKNPMIRFYLVKCVKCDRLLIHYFTAKDALEAMQFNKRKRAIEHLKSLERKKAVDVADILLGLSQTIENIPKKQKCIVDDLIRGC